MPLPAEADEDRWWPMQAAPKALVRLQNSKFPEPHAACEMMAQSVGGLAAKAVNEGRANEMVWFGIDNVDVEDWLARRLKRQPQLEIRGTLDLWDLVDRYARQGIIKGYILYRWDKSKGESNQHRPGMDCSVNVATSLAGTESVEPAKAKAFDPRTINWEDRRSAVTFIKSDGDNVQTFEGSFFRGSEGRSFWASPDRGKIPFGWSCCFAHLAQLCPEAIAYATATQSPNDWFLEWGGGYYYPDLFGRERTNRWDLLAQHARRTWVWMERTHTRVIGFNVSRFDSTDALKAYQVFANQTDGLLAILVWQYDCYEAGAGKTLWVKDRNGIEVPVISARYSIWSGTNRRPRSGTPAKVARVIRQTIEKAAPAELPRYDWVNLHAWSWFRKAPGTDENAEEMPQEPQVTAEGRGGHRGYTPAVWCAERLPANIRTVSPEELVWRLRMRHNPEQTRKLIQDWPR